MRKRYKAVLGILALATVTLAMTACGGHANTSSAMCAFIVGNGQGSNGSSVEKVIYPNEKGSYDDSKYNKSYVPCNSRNYIVSNGKATNANGTQIGDRFTATLAHTKTGVAVTVYWSAYWTLNENQEAMKDFWALCFKYSCSSDSDVGGDANFSTPGWNGMLGENFGPAGDSAVQEGLATMDDTIWQKQSPGLYDSLGSKASAAFEAGVQEEVGYNTNLFCGSGSSFWNPNHTSWTCSNVRIKITDVEPVNTSLGAAVQNESLNSERLAAAKALYGDEAGYWLGLQDTIGECTGNAAGTTGSSTTSSGKTSVTTTSSAANHCNVNIQAGSPSLAHAG